MTYTDDRMHSVPDKNCGIKPYQELSKWLPNLAKVLRKIPAKVCANKGQFIKRISNTSENTWITLSCKGKSMHIPQCPNWSTLSIRKSEIVKKNHFFIILDSLRCTSQEQKSLCKMFGSQKWIGMKNQIKSTKTLQWNSFKI